ncbi:hypothetical protein ACFVS2_26940 [Brevibacillus sp. NPDC058079]|uniref:hypothetical protein n=1 Tax=Brevibacillus sp. NPDC058079 TaxID=3346330 RepID=UPI0036E319A8
MFDELKEMLDNIGWNILKVCAIIAGGYLTLDIILMFASFIAPDKISFVLGGEIDNSSKSITSWVSKLVHSWSMFIGCTFVLLVWYFVLKKRKSREW